MPGPPRNENGVETLRPVMTTLGKNATVISKRHKNVYQSEKKTIRKGAWRAQRLANKYYCGPADWLLTGCFSRGMGSSMVFLFYVLVFSPSMAFQYRVMMKKTSSRASENNLTRKEFYQRQRLSKNGSIANGHSNCLLCSIFPTLVFGCINADFLQRKESSSVFVFVSSPHITPEC